MTAAAFRGQGNVMEFGLEETRSTASQKSNRSSARSSVLERARAYNKRVEQSAKQRSKSLERPNPASPVSPRSQSAGRAPSSGNRVSTRERAMASVRNESINRTSNSSPPANRHHSSTNGNYNKSSNNNNRSLTPSTRAMTPSSTSRSAKPTSPKPQQPEPKKFTKPSSPPRKSPEKQQEEGQEAIVTPELLVDALSGHEDGLLAIAERLMEHYDSGYDVMGEAIIDAFADVQKLFQHVVEAAHMEGAAFEASRREEEMQELRKQGKEVVEEQPPNTMPTIASPGGPSRHDEFIDQDVKDVLTEAIRKGAPLRDKNMHMECYKLFETACNSASALLPVDSDHRGRLQLSIARAESMSADRACAILRYAMDDVLRSGLRAGKVPLPDPSKRGDCVLSKPKDHPSLNGQGAGQTGVIQSSEEALASLVEEMKEVLNAPIYDNTPLQSVAERFWVALGEAQRSNVKNAEKLEHSLGQLKGEYLMARAEWEEKLTASQETAEMYKRKYMKIKENTKGMDYMDQARSNMAGLSHHQSSEDDDSEPPYAFNSVRTTHSSRSGGPGSVASLGSGLAMHAKSIASSFSCATQSDRGVLDESSPYRRSKSAPRSPSSRQQHGIGDRSFSNRSSTKRRSSHRSRQEMEV